MCSCKCLFGLLMIACVCAPAMARGLMPTKDEFAARNRWVAEHFAPAKSGKVAPVSSKSASAGLVVVCNHGDVQLNARGAEPLKIGDAVYKGGLYCHAPSKVIVRLPGPARSFSAQIGVDSRAGGGSVVFSVDAAGKELFRSKVLHGGEAAEAVSVGLNGASEFTLEVGDAGDGISCDQSNWADAKATLVDGREVLLGDLPIIAPELPGRSSWLLPFSFDYGGKPSDELLGTWKFSQSVKKLDKNRTQTTQTYVDPSTGLRMICVLVTYLDYPTAEWTLHFTNTGKADTPIISGIRAIDTRFTRGSVGEFELHRIKGDSCTPDSYQPIDEALGPNARKHIAPNGGRPTSGAFPYFNIEQPGGGVITVISWAGQWAADFARDDKTGLRVAAGQELTHFALHPGEQVRSPMVVTQFYKGDTARAQNIWRRWMLAHNMPKGAKPFCSTCIGGLFPGLTCSEADAVAFCDRYRKEGFTLDYWWTDAGWYICDPKIGWPQTGTWEPDPVRYPNGLRALSDYVHKFGMKHIVWFEPERVQPATWLTETHPEWVHGGKGGGLLRLDDPQCLAWAIEHFDKLITEQHIDLYRQDFNIDPLSYWRTGEPENRQGITENHHVTAYFAYWDELRRRHPGMLIDSCASGGRRNDLETLRRAVPLLRSDYQCEPVGNQAHTYGLSFWLPYYGTGVYHDSLYNHHSSLAPAYGICADIRKPDIDYALLRKTKSDWRAVADLMLGDYYPLTAWTLDKAKWIGFQFDRPDLGKGMMQAFRRQDNPESTLLVKPKGLESKATYKLEDLSSNWTGKHSGRELMEDGVSITVPKAPGDALIVYTKE
jgi:alpha-galactosidase